MTTRYTHTGSATVGQSKLQVRTQHSAHTTKITQALVSEITKARQLLATTLAQLNAGLSPEAKKLAAHYFLTPPAGPSSKDLAFIKNIILLTSNGLGSDQTIKVGETVAKPGDNRNLGGMVAYSRAAASKPHHSTVTDLGDGSKWRTGAMQIDQAGLLGGGDWPVCILVHEATHKYAGTGDYSYFDYSGDKPLATFTDRVQALQNADSYAWFVFKMGRAS